MPEDTDLEQTHHSIVNEVIGDEALKNSPYLPSGLPQGQSPEWHVNNPKESPLRHFRGDSSIKEYAKSAGDYYEQRMRDAGADDDVIGAARPQVEAVAAGKARQHALSQLENLGRQKEWAHWVEEALPFAGGIRRTNREKEYQYAEDAFGRGAAGIGDYLTLGEKVGRMKQAGDESWYEKMGHIAAGGLAFAGEVGMTGGLGAELGAAGAARLGGGKIAGKIAQLGAAGLGTTALRPTAAVEEYVRRGDKTPVMGEDGKPLVDAKGNFQFTEPESEGARVYNTALSQYIDNTVMPNLAGAFTKGTGSYAARVAKKTMAALAAGEASEELKYQASLAPEGSDVHQLVFGGAKGRMEALKNLAIKTGGFGVMEAGVQGFHGMDEAAARKHFEGRIGEIAKQDAAAAERNLANVPLNQPVSPAEQLRRSAQEINEREGFGRQQNFTMQEQGKPSEGRVREIMDLGYSRENAEQMAAQEQVKRLGGPEVPRLTGPPEPRRYPGGRVAETREQVTERLGRRQDRMRDFLSEQPETQATLPPSPEKGVEGERATERDSGVEPAGAAGGGGPPGEVQPPVRPDAVGQEGPRPTDSATVKELILNGHTREEAESLAAQRGIKVDPQRIKKIADRFEKEIADKNIPADKVSEYLQKKGVKKELADEAAKEFEDVEPKPRKPTKPVPPDVAEAAGREHRQRVEERAGVRGEDRPDPETYHGDVLNAAKESDAGTIDDVHGIVNQRRARKGQKPLTFDEVKDSLYKHADEGGLEHHKLGNKNHFVPKDEHIRKAVLGAYEDHVNDPDNIERHAGDKASVRREADSIVQGGLQDGIAATDQGAGEPAQGDAEGAPSGALREAPGDFVRRAQMAGKPKAGTQEYWKAQYARKREALREKRMADRVAAGLEPIGKRGGGLQPHDVEKSLRPKFEASKPRIDELVQSLASGEADDPSAARAEIGRLLNDAGIGPRDLDVMNQIASGVSRRKIAAGMINPDTGKPYSKSKIDDIYSRAVRIMGGSPEDVFRAWEMKKQEYTERIDEKLGEDVGDVEKQIKKVKKRGSEFGGEEDTESRLEKLSDMWLKESKKKNPDQGKLDAIKEETQALNAQYARRVASMAAPVHSLDTTPTPEAFVSRYDTVLGRMNDKALGILSEKLRGDPKLYDSHEDLIRAFYYGNEEDIRAAIEKGQVPSAFADMHADGTTDLHYRPGNHEWDVAHEVGHAIDNDQKISHDPAMIDAWDKDMADGQLTEYSSRGFHGTEADAVHEAVAEVWALLHDGGFTADIEQRFPNVSKLFKEKGLWPSENVNRLPGSVEETRKAINQLRGHIDESERQAGETLGNVAGAKPGDTEVPAEGARRASKEAAGGEEEEGPEGGREAERGPAATADGAIRRASMSKATTAAADDLVSNEPTSKSLDDIKERAGRALNYVRNGFLKFGGDSFPSTHQVDSEAGEKVTEMSVARDHGQRLGQYHREYVLGKDATPEQRQLVGGVADEMRLRYARQNIAQEIEKAAQGGDEGRAEMLRKQLDDMHETLIGQEGFPLGREQEFQEGLNNPFVKQAFDKYRGDTAKQLDNNYAQYLGIDADEIDTLTQIPGMPLNFLRGTDKGAAKGDFANLNNLRQKGNPFSKKASLSGDYNYDFGDMIDNSFQRGEVAAKQAVANRTLAEKGLLIPANPGESKEGFTNVENVRYRQPGDQVGKTAALIHNDVVDDYLRAKNVETPAGWKKISKAINQIPLLGALSTSVEGLAHLKNQLIANFAPGMSVVDTWQNAVKAFKGSNEFTRDLLSLSNQGAAKPPGEHQGVLEQLPLVGQALKGAKAALGYSVDPTYYMGEFIKKTDEIMRVSLARAYERAVPKEKQTQQGLTDFVNHWAFNYNKKAMPQILALAKETGIGPFAVATAQGKLRNISMLFGGHGMQGLNWGEDAMMRAQVFRNILTPFIAAATVNYFTTGRMDGGEDAPPLSIYAGIDDEGKKRYLDVGTLTGVSPALRALGLMAQIEGARKGETTGDRIDNSTMGIVHALSDPILGPGPRFAWTAVTGSDTYGKSVAGKAGYGESQARKNLGAAVLHTNPTAASLAEGGKSFGEQISGALGPFGFKYNEGKMPVVGQFKEALKKTQDVFNEERLKARNEGTRFMEPPELKVLEQYASKINDYEVAYHRSGLSDEARQKLRAGQAKLAQTALGYFEKVRSQSKR